MCVWWSYMLRGWNLPLDSHVLRREQNHTWLNPQTSVREKCRPEGREVLGVCMHVGVFRSYPVHTGVVSVVIKACFGLILHDGPCLNTTDICLEMAAGWERRVKFWVGEVNQRALVKQASTVYLHRQAHKHRPHGPRHQLLSSCLHEHKFIISQRQNIWVYSVLIVLACYTICCYFYFLDCHTLFMSVGKLICSRCP